MMLMFVFNIYSASPDEYHVYTEQLQKEYAHMNATAYKSMRLKVCRIHIFKFLVHKKCIFFPRSFKLFLPYHTSILPFSFDQTLKTLHVQI